MLCDNLVNLAVFKNKKQDVDAKDVGFCRSAALDKASHQTS